ncbi:MAG: SAM-dependent methyltransferase [Prevotella sp.]|nr:SAM-dependent methyltransferase [Prevotella sp.]
MRDFIREHRHEDVRQLALQAARYPDIDMQQALQQIAGWQTARTKLPEWAATEGIVYPPRLSMEQCSSEATAKYKAKVLGDGCWMLVDSSHTNNNKPPTPNTHHPTPSTIIDLTGGFGVDFSYMARGFQKAVYVERQPHLCEAARHNFQLLGLENAEVVCGDGVEYLKNLPSPFNAQSPLTIYLDPARRDENGKKTYAISDCTPDVVALKDLLLEKAGRVMIKLSPMLDWHKAVDDLGEVVEVHIVSVDNECKELLLVLAKNPAAPLRVVCANIRHDAETELFEFFPSNDNLSIPLFPALRERDFLYEPNASIMKAGCFAEVAHRFGVQPTGSNSHLFLSPQFIPDFPGRKFQIEQVTSMNKKELKHAIGGLTKANITVRNFPLSVAELRKRLKLADGGDTYIFATTLGEKDHVLLITKQIF